ncbi:hypothetical protein BAQU_0723 [Bifidobacterium aquikefiri]|uniref:Uncharacterized protein n=1 Tax=Bifidobacterium aquikefiri TaxID=1653207 RepID=A0A261G877_9BIFI|nr:hypothetical protein BAQU_0723 [Bifidobacterium aquikefiri]
MVAMWVRLRVTSGVEKSKLRVLWQFQSIWLHLPSIWTILPSILNKDTEQLPQKLEIRSIKFPCLVSGLGVVSIPWTNPIP